MKHNFKEGYYIFAAFVNEDQGFEKCATSLQAQVNAAEKDFDITFLSSASFKDDNSAGRNAYFGSQSAVLTKKVPSGKSK
jgi:hypothetical protein